MLRALHDAAPERAVGLIAHEHDVRRRVAKVVPQVVTDAPARAHAGAREDHRVMMDRIDAA